MRLRERVARNIHALRRERGLSQEELAHLADIDRGYMGDILNSRSSATLDKLENIARALNVDPHQLLKPER